MLKLIPQMQSGIRENNVIEGKILLLSESLQNPGEKQVCGKYEKGLPAECR